MRLGILAILVLVFAVMNQFPSFGSRENLYIGEEMFLSGEYIKAKSLYNQVDTNKLSTYEIQLLNYRLALLSKLDEALVILSNSSLPDAIALKSFLDSYINNSSKNIEDTINTQDELVAYDLLKNLDITKISNQNTLLSLKLYYSLSNLKVPKHIYSITSNGNEFMRLKNIFIDSIVFGNLGDSDRSQELLAKISSEYPNSFFAYIVSSNLVVQTKQSSKNSESSSGYYLTFQVSKVSDDALIELRSEVNTLNYSLNIVDGKAYIGPFRDKNSAIEFGKNISTKYRIEISLVKVSQK